jgi:hypothetical protein
MFNLLRLALHFYAPADDAHLTSRCAGDQIPVIGCATPSAILCGSVAIAAITSTALALLHDLDATVMVLVWTLGTAAVISSLGAAFGRRLLLWISIQTTRGPAEVTRLN